MCVFVVPEQLYLYLRFYVYMFVDLVKRDVLALVGEIRRYTNDIC